MAAVTGIKNLAKKGLLQSQAYPVKSGQSIVQGALAVVEATGYLYNLTAALAAQGGSKVVVFVQDGSENNNATTPSVDGSISGDRNECSGLSNGEKTCRTGWDIGVFRLDSISGLTQANIGDTVYATDNNTFNVTGDGLAIGYITEYNSATSCWIQLNAYKTNGEVIVQKGAVTAATTTTGGDAISWSPGAVAYVHHFDLDITTPATGAALIDVGIAANGTTTSDTLIDGADVGTAAIFATPYVNGGTNGKAPRKMTATQFITGTPSATLAGLVGTWTATYIRA
jgi:hypothetical protein